MQVVSGNSIQSFLTKFRHLFNKDFVACLCLCLGSDEIKQSWDSDEGNGVDVAAAVGFLFSSNDKNVFRIHL